MPLLSAVPLSCAAHRNAKYRFLGLSLSLSLSCSSQPCVRRAHKSQISQIARRKNREGGVFWTTQTGEGAGRLLAQTFKIQSVVSVPTSAAGFFVHSAYATHTGNNSLKYAFLKKYKNENSKKDTKIFTKKYKNKIRKHIRVKKIRGKKKNVLKRWQIKATDLDLSASLVAISLKEADQDGYSILDIGFFLMNSEIWMVFGTDRLSLRCCWSIGVVAGIGGTW